MLALILSGIDLTRSSGIFGSIAGHAFRMKYFSFCVDYKWSLSTMVFQTRSYIFGRIDIWTTCGRIHLRNMIFRKGNFHCPGLKIRQTTAEPISLIRSSDSKRTSTRFLFQSWGSILNWKFYLYSNRRKGKKKLVILENKNII